MPPTIAALISGRVDRLPNSARELLADAATLGLRFPLVHLRTMAGAGRFEEDLALVERLGLLDRQSEGTVATGAFRHVLTHEVVHGGLPLSARRCATDGRRKCWGACTGVGRTRYAISSAITGCRATGASEPFPTYAPRPTARWRSARAGP